MCGITGFLNRRPSGVELERMTMALEHRGPDDFGFWMDAEAGVALGHTRLAIIDTSPAGHQPMVSDGGRFVLAFNGEIYNHLELRAQLTAQAAAPNWRGHSDTETLLAAIAHWGLEETLRRTAGMFGLAVWDRRRRVLQLARDRLGEKPLYYGWAGESFVFGSELKAIKSHRSFRPRLCPTAFRQYLRFGYVPSPLSIWKGIFKLAPGCVLTVPAGSGAAPQWPAQPEHRSNGVSVSRYWSLADAEEEGRADPLQHEAEAVDEVEHTIELAVRRQMISDVPLGAFLSGGLDSSLVVALMQRNSAGPVRTFTIGFDEKEFDESRHAAAVARHLGTEHTEIRVTPAEAMAVIPHLPRIFDEPFADASQIPTFLVSQAARKDVTVALTGDAGDELFGGYERYWRAPKLWTAFSLMPFPLRRSLGAAVTAIPVDCWEAAMSAGGSIALKQRQSQGDRMHRLGDRLSHVRSIDDLYLNLVSSWNEPARILGPRMRGTDTVDQLPPTRITDPAGRMMYFDALTYLPDDILCKVDRAAMSVSLETRAPLLDPAVIAIAARLPGHMKIRGNQGKWILRHILDRHIPRAIMERPKLGFFLPIGQWLRGPLRGWADDLLRRDRLQREGFFACETVHAIWEEHLTGRRDWTLQVWTVLMFQAWAQANPELG